MTWEKAGPSGDAKRNRSDSARLQARRLMACVLLAVLVALSTSTAFNAGVDRSHPDEGCSDLPASSLTLTTTFTTSATNLNPGYVGEEVTFWANSSSSVGSSLTFTIFYDYFLSDLTVNPESGVSVDHTDSPGNVERKFTYNELGNFTLGDLTYFRARLYVNDGFENKSYNLLVFVVLNVNSPPVFVLKPKSVYSVNVSVPLNMSIQVMDPDSDPVDVFWEFGDGATATNNTDGTLEDRYVNQTHTWVPDVVPGTGGYEVEYVMNVTIVDGFGDSAKASSIVNVKVPDNGYPTISLAISSARVEPGSPVYIFANATDPEGEPLTWTFNYSDGTTEVVYTDWVEPRELVWCNMTHVYEEVGDYTITLFVSDAPLGSQEFPHNRTKGVSVTVAVNQIPGVMSKIQASPESPIINATIGFIDVYFSIDAKDFDGDVLTACWYLGDSVDPVVNTSAGGTVTYTFVQMMTITEPGKYNVSVVITDGFEGHDVTVSLVLNVTSDNMPPRLERFSYAYVSGMYALPGEDIEITIIISDREQDVIEVVLDFGDDSGVHRYNLSDYVDGNVTLNLVHSYDRPDAYTITLWFSDNKIGLFQDDHTITVLLEVSVQEPRVTVVTEWDWWDYTSLALVFMIPVLIAVRMLVLRRRMMRLEKEGLTLEEARIRNEEAFAEKLLRGGDGEA